ncbi:MAG: glycosyl transferase family 1, partial [Planctomycetes bacterium]|nr:glycosyl transferase family 1 [Planctomycetota bacterium]MCK5577925.1 glycosyl transferase family 1 [Planctomycetota bacterium]
MLTLKDYEPIVGTQVLDELKLLGQKLSGKIVQHINSTAVGGGVAEILNRMLPLLKEVGVDARWDVIKGDDKFFAVTKKIHNAIHHSPTAVTPEEFDILLETNRENARNMDFPGDIIFVHDPQPIALVDLKKELGKKWIWRCHI